MPLPGIESPVPELPEVETVANGVHERIAGQRVERVWTSGKPQTFKTPESEIVQTLTGSRIVAVRRVGKTVVADLQGSFHGVRASSSPADLPRAVHPQRSSAQPAVEITADHAAVSGGCAQLLVHLGMTGRLLVSAPEVPWPSHTHAVLTLSDGRELRFVDPRRFGRLSIVHPEPHTADGYTGPGTEPTTVSAEAFARLFRGRKLAIKAALLNQSILHGVGNIYADESLFRAGVRPRKAAGRLTRVELARLHRALQEVLARAIELGGSSVSDYVDAAGVRGFFQLEHKVYGRAGEACRDCDSPLRKIIVGGRTTVYCPTCQH